MIDAGEDFRVDRVGSALAGTNPTVLRRLPSGFAVIGDAQHLPGYCVLITADPAADRLADLPVAAQEAFLSDMALLGRAVAAVCARRDARFRRVNLEIQGNLDAFLHAHVTPRYDWEPADVVNQPAFMHHARGLVRPEHLLGPRHDDLRSDLEIEIDLQVAARG